MANLDLKDIKKMHDAAFEYSATTRERASDDLVFAWVTQWTGDLILNSNLEYKGQFDILRKSIRHIISELKENPVTLQFRPIDLNDDTDEEISDLMDGLYLTDDRDNSTMEAKSNAKMESVITGFGAYIMETEYQYKRTGRKNKYIRRRPIFEACNKVMFDPNSKLMDRSDATYVSVLTPYTPKGYIDLVMDLTGREMEETEIDSSFAEPEQSYSFPWISRGSNPVIYVTEFFYREMVKDTLLIVSDPFGNEMEVLESDFMDIEDELEGMGYQIIDDQQIERYQVTKYIASGDEILSEDEVDCTYLPVIAVYGERAIVENEEHYEGVVRLAKDPQRLHNFQLSYLADIVSRSPREKPIFFPEQIKGFEFMYNAPGSDNNYPYLLQNPVNFNGEPLPGGIAGVLPAPQLPQSLSASIELTRQAVEDVANPGVPQDVADPDASGKAILAVQNRLDQQALVYQQNFKHALRYDGQVYASMAAETYNFPRNVTLTKQDGTQVNAKLMENVVDDKGNVKVINDLNELEFSVFADVGATFTAKRDQTLSFMTDLMQTVNPELPIYQILLMKSLELMDGVNFDDVRKYARMQLIMMGIQEPETPEEKMKLMQMQMQQQDQPNPQLITAQAQMLRAQAQNTQAQTQAINEKARIAVQAQQAQASMMDAQTRAEDSQVKATQGGIETAAHVAKVQHDIKTNKF